MRVESWPLCSKKFERHFLFSTPSVREPVGGISPMRFPKRRVQLQLTVPSVQKHRGSTTTRPLDNYAASADLPAVSRLLKVVALLLATLWLPATVHCQLEGLGFEALFACADAGHGEDDTCTDGCQIIEDGQVAVTKSRIDVGSLVLLASACQFCLFEIPAPTTAPGIVASRQDETLPLQRTWQFDRRAALPARAPDTLNVARA
jgi:hypothetical protein